MFCPMISYHSENFTTIDCKKEKCAWYNKYKEECCIKTLVENIEDVSQGERYLYVREM